MDGVGTTSRRFEVPALPRGWIREEVYRKTLSVQPSRKSGGLSAGKCDVYYLPPGGAGKKLGKVRSKPELIKMLGDTVDLSTFDYRTGSMNSTLIKPRGRMPKTSKDKGDREDVLRANRTQTANLVPPIRQTASIFKQPVTVFKVPREEQSKVKNDGKVVGAEKPRQLFWEKRLNGLGARSAEAEKFSMSLPGSIQRLQAVIGEEGEVATNILLASISTALHLGNGPVTGQAEEMEKIEKNPTVFVNPSQPLMSAVEIGDKEIALQEERVQEARDRLATAIKVLHGSERAPAPPMAPPMDVDPAPNNGNGGGGGDAHVESKDGTSKLYFDNNWWRRGQNVYVEARDGTSYAATLSGIAAEVISVRRVEDGFKESIYLTQLNKGEMSIKRRAK